MTALCNQPEAFASVLGDDQTDQSRYLLGLMQRWTKTSIIALYKFMIAIGIDIDVHIRNL